MGLLDRPGPDGLVENGLQLDLGAKEDDRTGKRPHQLNTAVNVLIGRNFQVVKFCSQSQNQVSK
jgi:hypothetical protein